MTYQVRRPLEDALYFNYQPGDEAPFETSVGTPVTAGLMYDELMVMLARALLDLEVGETLRISCEAWAQRPPDAPEASGAALTIEAGGVSALSTGHGEITPDFLTEMGLNRAKRRFALADLRGLADLLTRHPDARARAELLALLDQARVQLEQIKEKIT